MASSIPTPALYDYVNDYLIELVDYQHGDVNLEPLILTVIKERVSLSLKKRNGWYIQLVQLSNANRAFSMELMSFQDTLF